jgi:hypothetical protein
MNVPRFGHTATRLTHGNVLVVGGNGGDVTDSSRITAEIFTEATGSWTRVGDLKFERTFHAATLLLDGRVLVTGGINTPQNSSGRTECEFFDPASRTWSMAPPLNDARAHHTATLLPDGRVIVVAGYSLPNALKTVEILDANQQSCTKVQPLSATRVGHTTTLLNGQAFVVGGGDFGAGEIYDEVNNQWSHLGILKTPRGYHSATPIFDLPNPWINWVPVVGGFKA